MPSAVLCKSESSCITLEKCVYAVLIRASSAVLHVPKEFPTTPSIKESNKYTHTPQVKQKAPIQHHNFLETTTTTKKTKHQGPQKQKKFFKKSLNCLILYSHESLEQLQTKCIHTYISMYVCMYVCMGFICLPMFTYVCMWRSNR